MAHNPIVKKYELPKDELEKLIDECLPVKGMTEIDQKDMYDKSIRDFEPDTVIDGTILNITKGEVFVDVGYKSEGIVSLDQWDNPRGLNVGDTVQVLLESVEDDLGQVVLSKRKADRILAWERIINQYKEGNIVSGRVTRKIKGGLLVDIGVPVFLPASQISIRRTGDIAEYIGQTLECKIIKIDEQRMNIVVSRRKLIEEQRERDKQKLMSTIEVGDIVRGVVKNIADFGAFVDLGGIDGLLHITDMSWGRVSHPSEVVNINDVIEVKILKIDKVQERISLGLKQKTESPWEQVDERYPIGTKHTGLVVNILPYGAFVKLEDGIEGLVHVSEMSWTKRVQHPNEVVSIGDEVEILVLEINKDKQEISLSMKETELNPWERVEEKYPVGTRLSGKIRNLTPYGAFVEIDEGIDGLLHVSDMSWTKKVAHPSEIIKKGDDVEVVVLDVDQSKKRIALGMKQLREDPWEYEIPNKYRNGEVFVGAVTKVTNFGVFVELEDNLEGLLHVSELAEDKVENPEKLVQPGQNIYVKVIRVDTNDRKIGLSLKQVESEELPEGVEAAIPQAEAKPESGETPAGEKPVEETETRESSSDELSAEPVPEPAVEVVPEPAAEVVPEPAVEVVPEPAVEVVPEPAVEAAPEPAAEAVPEPAVEAVPEPVVEVVPEPAVEVVPEPVVEVVPEPVVEAVPEPAVEVVPEPAVEVVPEPAVEVVPEPAVEVVPEPAVEAAPEAAEESAGDEPAAPEAEKPSE
ncbi:MAG: 30S ribosomal protein S1 [Planctomycetota bacterium]|jgi:small subunit ribosomal protein S1